MPTLEDTSTKIFTDPYVPDTRHRRSTRVAKDIAEFRESDRSSRWVTVSDTVRDWKRRTWLHHDLSRVYPSCNMWIQLSITVLDPLRESWIQRSDVNPKSCIRAYMFVSTTLIANILQVEKQLVLCWLLDAFPGLCSLFCVSQADRLCDDGSSFSKTRTQRSCKPFPWICYLPAFLCFKWSQLPTDYHCWSRRHVIAWALTTYTYHRTLNWIESLSIPTSHNDGLFYIQDYLHLTCCWVASVNYFV